MKILQRMVYTISMIFIMSLVMMINGCGSNKESKNEGCPSGSFLANSTDKMSDFTLGAIDRHVYLGSWTSVNGVPYVPEPQITVTDEKGDPRNNVCLVLTTNGFWWTDNTYTSQINGTGVSNQIIATTGHDGTVSLHWSTYSLPLSSAATSTTTDGSAVKYPAALIGVSSGAVSKLYTTADISIKGCPKESAGIATGQPGACP